MKKFIHENVLLLHGITIDQRLRYYSSLLIRNHSNDSLLRPAIVTQFMNKGDLKKYLKNPENNITYKQVFVCLFVC